MMFLAPWFLLGLLAAAIPLLLHLRRSRQARPIPFSCTRFFDEQFLRATRRARLQDLLLMCLRMTLVALLALALAQPLLRSGPLAELMTLGQAQHVVLVIDDSASMRRAGPVGSLLDHAKQQARQILESLSATRGDTAAVVLAGRRETGPAVLFPERTSDLQAVQQAVEQVQATDLATDLAGAVRRAGELAGDLPRARIIVLSDLQATGWDAQAAQVPATVSLLFVAVPASTTASEHNLSIDAIQTASASPMIGVPFTFRVLLTNHDTRPHSRRVQLHVGQEVVASREVELPPQRGTILRLVHRFAEPGWHACKVAWDPTQEADAFSHDDQRHVAVQVQPHLRVLAINGSPSALASQDELFFLAAALRVGRTQTHGVDLEVVAPHQVEPSTLTDYPAVVLANVGSLPEPVAQALRRYVDAGGGVLVTGGDRQTSIPGLISGGEEVSQTFALGSVDESHPALAGLDLRASLQRLRIDRLRRTADPDAGVLIDTADGLPLLVEHRRGAGRVLQWTSTIDRDWTDLPVQPVFVPLVHRWLTYLASPTPPRGTLARTGDRVELTWSSWGQALPRVTRPNGEPAYPTSDGSARAWLEDTTEAGVYQIGPAAGQGDGQRASLLAVNPWPQESVLAALSKQELEQTMPSGMVWAYTEATTGGDPSQPVLAQGAGLWDVLLLLALLAAVAEPWIANRLSRGRRRDAAPAVATLRGTVRPGMDSPASRSAA